MEANIKETLAFMGTFNPTNMVTVGYRLQMHTKWKYGNVILNKLNMLETKNRDSLYLTLKLLHKMFLNNLCVAKADVIKAALEFPCHGLISCFRYYIETNVLQ